jgi:hypothetical protein
MKQFAIDRLEREWDNFKEIIILDSIEYADEISTKAIPNISVYCYDPGMIRHMAIIIFKDWNVVLIYGEESKVSVRSLMDTQMMGYNDHDYKRLITVIGQIEDKFKIGILHRIGDHE